MKGSEWWPWLSRNSETCVDRIADRNGDRNTREIDDRIADSIADRIVDSIVDRGHVGDIFHMRKRQEPVEARCALVCQDVATDSYLPNLP